MERGGSGAVPLSSCASNPPRKCFDATAED